MGKARKHRKQRYEARAAGQHRRQQWTWVVAGAIVALLLVGVVAWSVRQTNQPVPGKAVSIQGQQHVLPGQDHPAYNSDPPTSGWHYEQPAKAGFYEGSLPDEQLVHNLEHGHVVISYDCSKLADCEAVKAELRQLVDRFQGWKVVAVSRENVDAAIALTAWGRIDKMDSYDEDRVGAFVRRWRDRGPERTAE